MAVLSHADLIFRFFRFGDQNQFFFLLLQFTPLDGCAMCKRVYLYFYIHIIYSIYTLCIFIFHRRGQTNSSPVIRGKPSPGPQNHRDLFAPLNHCCRFFQGKTISSQDMAGHLSGVFGSDTMTDTMLRVSTRSVIFAHNSLNVIC